MSKFTNDDLESRLRALIEAEGHPPVSVDCTTCVTLMRFAADIGAESLRTQLAACRAALKRYGQHQPPCLIPILPDDMDGCRCGLDAALAGGEG